MSSPPGAVEGTATDRRRRTMGTIVVLAALLIGAIVIYVAPLFAPRK
jgi:hypothetical protein